MEKITFDSYPNLLKEIIDPPPHLYYTGTLPNPENKILSIVGARKYTPYGKQVCEEIVRSIAGYPITIVSGLALGIDSIAHKAALRAGLQTIAIPGSGLDEKVLYPRSHINLARDIVTKGGGLLSEFEPATPGYPSNFPQRNRIIAGIAHATLVIEATLRSGTLITARLATDYNRDVLAVPGSIFSSTSEGPHDLIKHGAVPITSGKDVLEALGIAVEEERSVKRMFDDCTEMERHVLHLLKDPLSRDELIRRSSLDVRTLNTTLATLEIKGHVKEHLGKLHIQVA